MQDVDLYVHYNHNIAFLAKGKQNSELIFNKKFDSKRVLISYGI